MRNLVDPPYGFVIDPPYTIDPPFTLDGDPPFTDN